MHLRRRERRSPGWHCPIPVWLLPLALAVPGTPGASAQVIAGRVLEEGSEQPVPSVLVELISPDSVRRDGTITTAEGRFSLRAGAPGRYLVRLRRLGYRTTVFGPFDVTGNVVRDLALPAAPIALQRLSASGERRCGGELEEARETAVLWDLISSALETTTVIQGEGLLEFELLRFERRTDLDRSTLQSEAISVVQGDSPFRSPPAEQLESEGFVEPLDDGFLAYYMPDPEVLTSNAFLRSHCFHVVEPEDGGRDRIGLAFEPPEDRPELPATPAIESHPSFRTLFEDEGVDVAGVLWVDRESGALETLEYRYEGYREDDFEKYAGGYARFEQLASGAWVVRQWWIRSPNITRERTRLRSARPRLDVTGLREDGGYLVNTTTPDGRVATTRTGRTVTGQWLPDDIPISVNAVVVRLSGSDRIAQPNSAGGFVIPDVPPGRYLATYYAPKLDTLGIAAPAVPIEIGAEAPPPLTLRGPRLSDVRDEVCPGMDDDDERGTLLVRAVREDGRPLRSQPVQLEARRETDDFERMVLTNDPEVRFCKVPTGVPLEVRVSPWEGGRAVVTLDPFGFARVDLTLLDPGS